MVVTGIVTAGVLKGEGSDITSLNATNIKSGIVSNAYLQAGYEFSGILTASQFKGNVLGDVVGFATTARDLIDGLSLVLLLQNQLHHQEHYLKIVMLLIFQRTRTLPVDMR
jgi:hypothetical protein